MTDDDWEPLPVDQRGLHPGELPDLQKRDGVPTPPPALASVVATDRTAQRPRRDPAAEAAAERAIAELKNKLSITTPGTSLIAEVQHREQREERKRKSVQAAAARAIAGHTATMVERDAVQVAGDAGPAPDLEIDTATRDIDPRETEPWFAELPKKEQERLRTHWWYERHRNDDAGMRLRQRIGRAIAHGALLFFVMSLLLIMLLGSFVYVPLLTGAGGLAAGLAELCGGGRVRYGVAGALSFVLVLGPTVLLQPFSFVALMLLSYGMATLGMDGEMRKTGGFGDR